MGRRIAGFILLSVVGGTGVCDAKASRPNVLLIITDDQGYGDLGVTGNAAIRTPRLDRLARESVRLERFYVSPVCAPTRASLLTGRYAYRTGAVDTYLGRALMHPEEVTLAEMLGAAGYRTAIFGKWHLGDNYPLRAMDQGFQESLVIKGGGIGQPSDPPVAGGGNYFDPILQHNGREIKAKGYCSDVFTTAAVDFLAGPRDKPFFIYLAFNAPHTPLQVPDDDYAPYKTMDLGPGAFPKVGQPVVEPVDRDATARVYGMVSNIDRNLERLFAKLDSLGLTDETIVIFLTDNGPQQPRYNSGMRGLKGSVYDGGTRVPCFIRWPGRLRPGKVVDRIAAAMDLAPTLLDACRVERPPGVAFDGRSLLTLLEGTPEAWPDRTIYLQWHRGDVPERYRAFAARSQRYKLLRPETASGQPVGTTFELYSMEEDPFEFRNLADQSPTIVAEMRAGYEAWFDDVGRARGYEPPRIVLGADQENPSTLTRQDWRGPRAGWRPDDLGYWEVRVAREGLYRITLVFPPRRMDATAHFALGTASVHREVPAGAGECTFGPMHLASGPGRLEAMITAADQSFGASYVHVKRLD